jgi:hypothetical protein
VTDLDALIKEGRELLAKALEGAVSEYRNAMVTQFAQRNLARFLDEIDRLAAIEDALRLKEASIKAINEKLKDEISRLTALLQQRTAEGLRYIEERDRAREALKEIAETGSFSTDTAIKRSYRMLQDIAREALEEKLDGEAGE